MAAVLNPRSPVPLYRQLADVLLEQMKQGQLETGARLPSEPELVRRYGIGRPTVRQATELLERRGLVERRRGAGTFVAAPVQAVDIFSLAGTLSAFQSRGLRLETRLLERVAKRPVGVDSFNPFSGREAFSFVRLSKVHAEPVLIEHVYLEPEVFPDLHKAPLAGASLAEIVRERYYREPSQGQQSFHVACGSRAVQSALDLAPDQPVLLIRRTLDFAGAPKAIFSELYCRTDRVTFSQPLVAPSSLERPLSAHAAKTQNPRTSDS
ncbi:MAG TPA: GntR family transcriptional regulator [Polyangiaceae bacterium]|jgi:GntR family transcriptional regulator|nr:GntR family transcriptional regulator [Polyangiaceae bacterium]